MRIKHHFVNYDLIVLMSWEVSTIPPNFGNIQIFSVYPSSITFKVTEVKGKAIGVKGYLLDGLGWGLMEIY